MNKNLRKIIALALAFGGISSLAPVTGVNLLTTKVYAADTTDENTDDEFDRLELLNDDGNNIKIYEDDDYDNKVDDNEITSTGEYYVKTSSDVIEIDKSGVDDKYVKVFKGTSDRAKGKDVDDDISISDDTTITVKIYNQDVDGDTVYYDDDENDDDLDCIGEYEIHVEYTGSSSDEDEDEADDYDDIYLEKLSVDGELITLSDDKVNYSYNVANNVKEVYIRAVPEDEDDDEVTIDDDEVYEDDSWKKKVSLKEGENKFEIEVQNDDDDDDRTYTLTINRAKAVAATNTNTGTTNAGTVNAGTKPANTAKTGWVQSYGRWQYFDSFGTQYKSKWLYDMSYGKWYYLGADGYMYTGWLFDGGKYYYLNADGSMAINTTIGGYKVGPTGAWIK